MKAEGIQPVKIESPRRKGELVDALPNETVLRLLKIVDGQAGGMRSLLRTLPRRRRLASQRGALLRAGRPRHRD